jgi:hypothetical protein
MLKDRRARFACGTYLMGWSITNENALRSKDFEVYDQYLLISVANLLGIHSAGKEQNESRNAHKQQPTRKIWM